MNTWTKVHPTEPGYYWLYLPGDEEEHLRTVAHITADSNYPVQITGSDEIYAFDKIASWNALWGPKLEFPALPVEEVAV